MNPNPLEKEIEVDVVKFAKDLGILVYKFTSPSQRSVPDRMFVMPERRTFFIEFKRRGEVPTVAQEVEIAKIRKRGIFVGVVDNKTAGRRMVADQFHGVKKDDF